MKPPKLSGRALSSLGRAVRNAGALRGEAIGAQLRETVILHVSAVNSCAVCSAAHGVAGRKAGLSDGDIAAARACEPPESLDERTRAALRYAELRTRGEEAEHPEDVRRFEGLFSNAEQREVRAIVDLFTFNNRFSNTWESVLPGAARRRRKLGIPC